MTLEEIVTQTIIRHRLIDPGDRILVACSGGPDSTALLHVLARLALRWPFTLAVMHVNHGLRGAEGARDEDFCRAQAAALDLPFHRVDLPAPPPSGANLEEWLRLERYRRLRECQAHGFDRLAVGHTLDDQAETFLLRLFRGAGLSGLSCMTPAGSHGLIRPLLEADRETVLRFLAAAHIACLEDSSNRDSRFMRNRIRHTILPLIRSEINPAVSRVLARTAEVLRHEHDALYQEVTHRLHSIVKHLPEGICFRREEFISLPDTLHLPAIRQLIRSARPRLRKLGTIHFRQSLDFILGAASGTTLQLPGPVYLYQSYGQILIAPRAVVPTPFEYRLQAPGQVEIAETGERFTVRDGPSEDASAPGIRLEMDDPMLIFRTPRAGDRILSPVGHRKLKKVFQEHRIPTFERHRLTVITDRDDQILWIPRISQRLCYNKHGKTPRILTITKE